MQRQKIKHKTKLSSILQSDNIDDAVVQFLGGNRKKSSVKKTKVKLDGLMENNDMDDDIVKLLVDKKRNQQKNIRHIKRNLNQKKLNYLYTINKSVCNICSKFDKFFLLNLVPYFLIYLSQYIYLQEHFFVIKSDV